MFPGWGRGQCYPPTPIGSQVVGLGRLFIFISTPYLLPRVTCCPPSSAEFRGCCEGSVGLGSVGQHDGGFVHQSSGWYSFPVSVSTSNRSLGLVSASSDSPLCFPYSRRGYSSGRLPFEKVYLQIFRLGDLMHCPSIGPVCIFNFLCISSVLNDSQSFGEGHSGRG